MTLTQAVLQEVSPSAPSCLIHPERSYSPRQLVALLLSPRGIEHALATGRPRLGFLQAHRPLLEGLPLTLLEEGETLQCSSRELAPSHAFAGKGRLVLSLEGGDCPILQTLVLLHGLDAEISASDGAIVRVHADASCSVQLVASTPDVLFL